MGLDADIWYQPMPERVMSWIERETLSAKPLAGYRDTKVIESNWRTEYVKILRLAATDPKVQRILTHPAVKKKLCDSETGDKAWLQKVRPIYGHNYHFHVRFFCPKGSKGCRAQKAVTSGHGCGKPLDYWLKLVSRPPKPVKKVKKKAMG